MCLVSMKAIRFFGPAGNDIEVSDIDAEMLAECKVKRALMIEKLGEVDDKIGEVKTPRSCSSTELLFT